jgi:hypothetical protein
MKVLITFLLTSLAYHGSALPGVNDDPKIDTSEMNAIPKDEKVSMHTSKVESRFSEGQFLSKLRSTNIHVWNWLKIANKLSS